MFQALLFSPVERPSMKVQLHGWIQVSRYPGISKKNSLAAQYMEMVSLVSIIKIYILNLSYQDV